MIKLTYKAFYSIICPVKKGFYYGKNYIYVREQEKWFLLEYHSRPMVGDYSKRQNIPYETNNDRLKAEGRVRATSLALTLKRN